MNDSLYTFFKNIYLFFQKYYYATETVMEEEVDGKNVFLEDLSNLLGKHENACFAQSVVHAVADYYDELFNNRKKYHMINSGFKHGIINFSPNRDRVSLPFLDNQGNIRIGYMDASAICNYYDKPENLVILQKTIEQKDKKEDFNYEYKIADSGELQQIGLDQTCRKCIQFAHGKYSSKEEAKKAANTYFKDTNRSEFASACLVAIYNHLLIF